MRISFTRWLALAILTVVVAPVSVVAMPGGVTATRPVPGSAPATADESGGARERTSALPAATSTASARAYPATALRGPLDESSYVLGPGDLLQVSVSAVGSEPQNLVVTPEGDLLIPGVASVRVSGLTWKNAKERVRDALERSYRNVDVKLSLVALRRVEIHVTGAVHTPGTYVGTAMDVASSIIALAGGLMDGASRRDIQLRDSRGRTRRVDLTRYERLGDAQWNPPVLDSNALFVPFAKTEIYVFGAVEMPGVYEFVPGDTIRSLVEIAGGLRRDARPDSVELRRFIDDRETETLVLPWSEGTQDLALRDGDQIYVRFSEEYRRPKSVVVTGEVRFPGPFGITEGEDRVSDVLARAGGVTADASASEARLIRSGGAEKTDLEFERLKTVPIQDMSKAEYAYFKGKSREHKGLVVLDFAKLLAGDEAEDRLLRDGDRIVIPERRETITVSGTVSFPGLIPYLPGQRAGYYIAQAGGYASNADKGETQVIRALTGEWESTGDAGEIVPGDEIWVPDRPDRDWWQFTQEAVRFAASVATVYLVIDRAVKN